MRLMAKIQAIHTQDVQAFKPEELGGAVTIRQVIDRSHGSERIQLWHSVVDEGFETETPGREDQDEVAYIISGEAEVESEGALHRLGPGSVIFIPPNTAYKYRVIKGPHEMVAAISPPDQD